MASRPSRARVNPNGRNFRRCVSQKIGFPTYGAALDAAERLMLQGRVNPGCHITPYACESCGEWHVANRIIVPMDARDRRILRGHGHLG